MFAASKTKRVAAAAATTDQYFPYVPLLLETTTTNGQQNNTFLDSSTNNFTITRNGTPTQGSVTPYWTSGQWSNYFDASKISISYSTATDISSGNFTIEFFVFAPPQSASNVRAIAFFDGAPALANNIGWDFVFATTNSIYFEFNSGGTGVIGLTSGGLTNSWNHIAVTRSGSTFTIWLNGVSQNTGTSSATGNTNSSWATTIGSVTALNTGACNNVYISNFRILKGTALYSSTFTPPTSPLTAITNTAILTCQNNRLIDNSTNAFTISATNTIKIQAFQPFSPSASYTTASYGGSAYFNGSSDYLSLPTNAALTLSGDFTVEFFIFITATSNNQTIWAAPDAASDRSIQLDGTTANISYYDGTALRAFGSTINNTWAYIALSRTGTTVQGFYNGVRGFSVTDSGTLEFSAANLFRRGRTTAGNYFNGYGSNFRIVKGTGLYSGTTITVPTAPLSAITNTSLLLNFTNAGIYDAAVQNNVITVGDAQASTTQYKWSPTSMKYDGTGDWLTAIDSPQLQLGTGDFTIEGWLYLSANGVIYGIVSKGTATTGWSVNVTVLNKLQFSYTASNLTGTTSLAASTWYYFAVVRSGSATGNLKVYLNGSVEATSGGAVTDNFNQTNILYIGADRIGSTPLNGYLQDVRITKLARTITTPTAAFPTR